MVMDLKTRLGETPIPDLIKAGVEVRIRHKDGKRPANRIFNRDGGMVTMPA